MIDFHFVHVDASSAKARKRNHQLARAHSARTHRRKRRDELVDITVYDPSELPLVAAKVGKDVEPRKAKWVMERSLSSTPMVSRTVTPVPRRALLGDEVVEMLLSPPPSKTVSPVFGPFAPATFTPSTSLRSEQVAHYRK